MTKLLLKWSTLPEHSIESMLSKAASSTKEELEALEKKLSKLTVPHLKGIGRKFHVRVSMLGKKKSDIVRNLLAFGQERKLNTSFLTTHSSGATKLSLDESVPSLILTIEDWLLRGEKNGDSVWLCLRKALTQLTSDGLHVVADAVAAKLTGTSSKVAIIDGLIVLSQVGSLQNRSDDDVPRSLSYVTDVIKKQLSELPTFEKIDVWSKSLNSVKQFHFINLYTYLVESRDKTFDRDSLRAFKSLKGYKYFSDGFVNNMWLYKQQQEVSKSNLVVLRAFEKVQGKYVQKYVRFAACDACRSFSVMILLVFKNIHFFGAFKDLKSSFISMPLHVHTCLSSLCHDICNTN